MPLTRRTGQRFQASIWPGFVDAMTALLLVLMFVLSIFMIVQFMLRETITGQESRLSELNAELSALASALGLEQQNNFELESQLTQLTSTLGETRSELDAQKQLVGVLNAQLEEQQTVLSRAQARITDFEAQVAALLLERDRAIERSDALSAELDTTKDQVLSLETVLAATREERDAEAEAARLAAARREALEAMIAQIKAETAEQAAAQQAEIDALSAELSEAEAARLTEAAAVQALREKLAGADDELTAMTLALEAKRKEAEDTLTLLAAARAEKERLDAELSTLSAGSDSVDRQAALLAAANAALAEKEAESAESQRKIELMNQQLAALRAQLGDLQGVLDEVSARDSDAKVQIDALGRQLNAALARAAAEERRRAELEEAERLRLEEEARRLSEEAQDLQNYRSEFFGRLRAVLAGREGVRVVGDRFVFSSEVLFQLGSVTLSPEGKSQITNVVEILRDVADKIPDGIDWIIRVDGHTDDTPLSGTGRYRNNWELSQGRALSVVEFMIDQMDFPPRRLTAAGFGEYRPVNPADTEDARAQNRRIELKLTER